MSTNEELQAQVADLQEQVRVSIENGRLIAAQRIESDARAEDADRKTAVAQERIEELKAALDKEQHDKAELVALRARVETLTNDKTDLERIVRELRARQ